VEQLLSRHDLVPLLSDALLVKGLAVAALSEAGWEEKRKYKHDPPSLAKLVSCAMPTDPVATPRDWPRVVPD